jgi:hypothetical protein
MTTKGLWLLTSFDVDNINIGVMMFVVVVVESPKAG